MHLITTDLDKTLIFSKRSMDIPMNEAICIEKLDGEPISFINKTVEDYLHVLKQHHFIAVTSRSMEQLQRLQLPIFSGWMIAANGGIIAENGRINEEWANHVRKQLKNSLPANELIELLKSVFDMTIHGRWMDELFYVCRLEQSFDVSLINSMIQHVGWYAVQNGRKLYILPNFLQKQHAVQFIKCQVQYDQHFAAGDSIMDVEMLRLADRAFAPYASEAGIIFKKAEVPYKGIAFSSYFLQQIAQAISSNAKGL